MKRINEKLKRTNTNVQLHIMSKKKNTIDHCIRYIVHWYFNIIVLRNETQPVVYNLKYFYWKLIFLL